MTLTQTRRAHRPTTTTTVKVPTAYERISKFRVARDGIDTVVTRGVDRQAQDNNTCAQALGLGPLRHFTDNDRSASQYATKEREEWLQLLEFVRAGAASHVLVWLFDRAARTTEDTEALLAACRAGDALIVQTAGSPIVANPHNPDDIFRLKLAGLLAEYEVAKMSVRQKRHKEASAQNGTAHGGRRRFGYRDGMRETHPAEAAAIQELADRLLAGESLYSLATFLNTYEWVETDADGVTRHRVGLPTSSSGATWTGPNVRNLILRPHLAGLRIHHGEVIGDGTWPPILTRATHEAIVARLSKASRKKSTSNARVYLLAGLATCDACGAKLRGRPANAKVAHPVYACSTGRHVHRSATDVDYVVVRHVKALLRRLRADGVFVDDAETARVDDLHTRKTQLGEAMAATALALVEGRIKQRGHDATMLRLETELEDVEAALEAARDAALRPDVALKGLVGPDPEVDFDNCSLTRRRAVIATLMSVSVVGAGTARRRAFEPEDVKVTLNRVGDSTGTDHH